VGGWKTRTGVVRDGGRGRAGCLFEGKPVMFQIGQSLSRFGVPGPGGASRAGSATDFLALPGKTKALGVALSGAVHAVMVGRGARAPQRPAERAG